VKFDTLPESSIAALKVFSQTCPHESLQAHTSIRPHADQAGDADVGIDENFDIPDLDFGEATGDNWQDRV
jgi:hypothetical protein